jgi:sulfonate transport system permease protein
MPALETRTRRRGTDHDAEIAGIDALETGDGKPSRRSRVWAATWPKALAVAIVLLVWQAVVWLEWKPRYIFPGPGSVFASLWDDLGSGVILRAVRVTMGRAFVGYSSAIAIGGTLGILVARNRVFRSAIGSLITGLQTMPSIAWFPLAIVLFGINERAIFFVVVLGAAPSIANGVISGIDHVPPTLLRAGRTLGARGIILQRHVVVPAALPGVVAGLKQGWAFAWRSLMAGELLVPILEKKPSLGLSLQMSREAVDYERMMATMIVILVIGILVDSLFFGRLERAVRSRFGLIDEARPA